jgi:hypothetical protein
MKKLHLGCGQIYLEGYTNIDYPLEVNHSVQQISVADKHINLLDLKYNINSVDEIRLHHVFEHFSRPNALALVASWNSWLKVGGTLRIETPNYSKMAFISINPFFSIKKRGIALRHIFGSQEAHWANHFEGYSKRIYKQMLPLFGFEIQKFQLNRWHGTHNIEVFAKKVNYINKEDAISAATDYLKNYLLNDSEQLLLNYWTDNFKSQLDKSFSC